ncbi:hypothetical protein SAMN02745216_03500 [Desulfatibacillum alkenivorans DSM 16219]|uniref:Uncharacterized protein n=1 Tax=Desulfatibacillum alkenivorans DSM 16219 TaxID=1121393 RepID=A0A1M6SQJ6_9BACT|nr:hypothetical protein [Desulfatibacillum alkenivorans]SHK46993.1 hypothetical protein SAMN02745216_03500 [Desulfatibacillum alkenivorans DSM 16219]
MEQDRYTLLFSGQVAAGRAPQEVKANLAKMFKATPDRIEKMFTGKPVIIKKGLTSEQAMKYQLAFEKAGAICRLAAEAGQASKPQAPVKAAPQPSEPAASSSAPAVGKTEEVQESEDGEEDSSPEKEEILAKAKKLYILFDEAYDRALKKDNAERSANINVGIGIVFLGLVVAVWYFTSLKWYWALLMVLAVLAVMGLAIDSAGAKFVRGILEPVMKQWDDKALVLAAFERWKEYVGDSPIKDQFGLAAQALEKENPRFRSRLEEYRKILAPKKKKKPAQEQALTLAAAAPAAPAAPAASEVPAAAQPVKSGGKGSSQGHESYKSSQSKPRETQKVRTPPAPRPPQEDPLYNEIRLHLSQLLGGKASALTMDAPLPLHANPMIAKTQLESVLEGLESIYSIVLPYNAQEGMSTVGDVVRAVHDEMEVEGKLESHDSPVTVNKRGEPEYIKPEKPGCRHIMGGVIGFLAAGGIVVPLVQAGAKAMGLTGDWPWIVAMIAGVTAWGAIAAMIRGE